MTGSPIFSAVRLAELLTEPDQRPLLPTKEQRRAIEHPLAGSALVIAGAGSGKTATMVNRVVWLIVNNFVEPEQVLGLTFTRKAAGELRERVVMQLERLVDRFRDSTERGALSPAEAGRAAVLLDELSDGLNQPDISTYNSFAAAVLQEFGAAAGIAPGAAVIDEATAWRIAREVVLASDDPDLVTSTLSLTQLVQHVISMDHAVADNLTSLERIEHIVAEFSGVLKLPYNEKDTRSGEDGKSYAPVKAAVANVAETPLVARLARAFALEKRSRGLIEYSDQLALATRVLESSPDAVRVLRARHRAVLLDEVQDTSVGQTHMLSTIFAGSPVMAVGDPHQSIYGWRGASAAGLESFHRDFRGPERGEPPAETLTLTTSWRNPTRVLDAAMVIARPLIAESQISVPNLTPSPQAEPGTIEWRYPETVHEEREEVARWLADARREHQKLHGTLPTSAAIFRNRRHMAAFHAALTDAGVPARIVGLGGLLSTPEVTDIVSALRCVWYADAGGDLIRLLSGPRFRVGVADLAGLRSASQWFAGRDVRHQRLTDEDREPDGVLPDPDLHVTIIDALDQLQSIRDSQHAALRGISAGGLERLRDAAHVLTVLRRRVDADIGDLIGAVVRALRIDIELESNEARAHGGGAAALANIDAFIQLARGYLAIDSRGTLPALLEWIERAKENDEAAEHVPAPTPGTVQLITAHGAKGLEWDIVALPRMVEGEFPAGSRDGVGWLRKAQLPDELRRDADARPKLNWRLASHQKELRDRIDDYKAELKERELAEQRRLAYVAITRTESRLLLSGSFWGGQVNPRQPSPYLLELQDAGLITGLPEGPEHEEDPSADTEATLRWPLDPLGDRAAPVLRAAAAVRERLEQGPRKEPAINDTVQLLIAEREREEQATGLQAPERITASTFHEFLQDPVGEERRRLRPVPQRPYRRTRIGNRFHEWVERRATTARGTALPLFGIDPEEWDPGRAEFEQERELEPLIEVFERSRWANRSPIAVELEVTLPFAGRTLVCKLDAVYQVEKKASGDGAPVTRFEVVDWKAGRSPKSEAERETRFFQLDLYRHAYAQWAGIDPGRIDVSLFYVSENIELQGRDPRSLEQLEQLWADAATNFM